MPAQKRAPRLKESCDSCSTAKVRCCKDKPICSRCQQKGLPCSYSYSRRAGRRTTTNHAITKADRRSPSPSSRASSPSPFSETPSASSSLDQQQEFSPESDTSPSPDFDMTTSWPTSNPFLWDLQNSLLNQYAFPTPFDPTTTAPPPAIIPTPFDAMDIDISTTIPPGPAPAAPMMTRNFSSATSFSDISSLSSASSSMTEAVHDELSNLTSFAEGMEKKFDAVVRARLQYRDPVEDLEVERMLGSEGGKGGVPSPDCNELAFYYSLAELKRRLKWVREDVGCLMGGGQGNPVVC